MILSKQHKQATSKQAAERCAIAKAMCAVSDEVRNVMIAETAYLFAEQRGFQGDVALDDWLRVEAEINARQ